MKILEMKCYGDFDSVYTVNLGVGEDSRIQQIEKVLNDFCATLPGCDNDVKLIEYLNSKNYTNTLLNSLVEVNCFSSQQALDFINSIIEKCKIHWVYVYSDTFIVEDIETI